MTGALAPGGVLVEGTCDELGRLASWVCWTGAGPRTLTLAARLSTLERPATLAERLPKALIHHNVPGSRSTRSWPRSTPRGRPRRRYATFGPRQRWLRAVDGGTRAPAGRSWPRWTGRRPGGVGEAHRALTGRRHPAARRRPRQSAQLIRTGSGCRLDAEPIGDAVAGSPGPDRAARRWCRRRGWSAPGCACRRWPHRRGRRSPCRNRPCSISQAALTLTRRPGRGQAAAARRRRRGPAARSQPAASRTGLVKNEPTE